MSCRRLLRPAPAHRRAASPPASPPAAPSSRRPQGRGGAKHQTAPLSPSQLFTTWVGCGPVQGTQNWDPPPTPQPSSEPLGPGHWIPVWAGWRGGGPGGSSLGSFHTVRASFPPPPLHLPRGLQARGAPPPSSPAAQPGCGLRLCQPPSLTPGPARLPSSFPELRPLAVATEGLARVPGTTPQRPASLGQGSGQSQSVWQGCGFRIGWSCPRLWEEGDARGGR